MIVAAVRGAPEAGSAYQDIQAVVVSGETGGSAYDVLLDTQPKEVARRLLASIGLTLEDLPDVDTLSGP